MGQNGAILKLIPGLKKNSQTHLLKLNPISLGTGWVPEKTRPIVIPKHVLDMEMVKCRAKDICDGWHVKCDIKWWLKNETNKSPPIFPSILLMVFFLIKSFVCYELIEWHESIYIEMFVSIFFFFGQGCLSWSYRMPWKHVYRNIVY